MAGVLQHLRSSTLDKRPNPASMVDGQVAINYASGSPGMFFKDSNGDLVKVGPVHVGATAPNVSPASGGTTGNSIGEQWLDTSGGTYVFKIWDGAAWRTEAGEFVNAAGDTMTGSLTMGVSANIIFEGSVDDGFETTLTVANPTADRTITLPNVTGTVVTTGDSGTITSAMIADGAIVNTDINASAAIADTKLATISTTGKVSNSATTATSANTASAIVARDASGNFSAGTITAALSGNATSANSVNSSITFNNGGAGGNSGSTFNGGSALTVSFNTIGAASSGHIHGNITNAGAIGSTANRPIITTTNGVLTTSTFGTSANTFCQGNDVRLSDTRNTTNSVTFNNGGSGGSSGSSFNGSSALTVSYNTVGAPSATGANASGTWGINITGDAASVDGKSFGTFTAAGGILYATSTTAASAIGAGATGQFLKTGVSAAPSWVTLEMTDIPGATYKKSARVATTAALTATFASNVLTNSGTLAALSIDGVALALNDRVLVKNQATAAQNGIYTVTNAGSVSVAWTLTRAADADTNAEIGSAVVAIDAGTTNGGEIWTTTFKATDTLNSTAMNWYEIVYNSGSWSINITGSSASCTGNAATATNLSSNRTFQISGDIAGSVSNNLSSGFNISTAISAGVIVNADVNTSAAIAGTKISPNFGSQNIATTGNMSAGTTSQYGVITADKAVVFNSADAPSSTTLYLTNSTGGTNANGAYGPSIGFSKINSGLRPGAAIAVVQTTSDSDQNGLAFFTHSTSTTDNTLYEAMRLDHAGSLTVNAEAGNSPSIWNLGVSEAARIDSSGRLLIGTSTDITGTNNQLVQVSSSAGATVTTGRSATTINADFFLGGVRFRSNAGSSWQESANILAYADADQGANDKPGRLVFSTTPDGGSSPTERMRIDSDGSVLISGTDVNPGTAVFGTRIGGSTTAGYFATSRNVSGTSAVINIYGNAGQFRVLGDGDAENTNNRYTGISDIKLKQNIEDATSQWDDIKAIKVRKYEFIASPDRKHIGVVAQELEQVCPGLVLERINDEETGETTKSVAYSVLYMKAVKALQEAMERIETLEQRLNDAGIN